MRMIAVPAAMISVIIGSLMPASAAELKLCNDIKNDQERMACLQEHIVLLEDEIVRLEGDIAQLSVDLDQKLGAAASYRLMTVAPGTCLGGAGEGQPPVMVKCDGPEAWRLKLVNASAGAHDEDKKKTKGQPIAEAPDKDGKPVAAAAPAGQGAPSDEGSWSSKTKADKTQVTK
jgi:hypothetical protein